MLRKLSPYLIVSLAVLGVVGNASAAVLNWEGTTIVSLGDFQDTKVVGGGVATINGSAGGLPAHLQTLRLAASRGNVSANFTKFVTDPDTQGNQIASLQFINVAGGTGTFAPISGILSSTATSGAFAGNMPVMGVVRLCLGSTECLASASLVLTTPPPGPAGTATATIGIGLGGLLTINILNGFARISVQANPWQIKTANLQDQITTPTNYAKITVPITYKGFAHDPASGTTNTAEVGGVVQLISASQIVSDLANGSSAVTASAQRFLIRFIPEPGMLLMLGSGIAGLVLIGRKRMRK